MEISDKSRGKQRAGLPDDVTFELPAGWKLHPSNTLQPQHDALSDENLSISPSIVSASGTDDEIMTDIMQKSALANIATGAHTGGESSAVRVEDLPIDRRARIESIFDDPALEDTHRAQRLPNDSPNVLEQISIGPDSYNSPLPLSSKDTARPSSSSSIVHAFDPMSRVNMTIVEISPDVDSETTVTFNHLNQWYEYVSVFDEIYEKKYRGEIIRVACSDLASIISSFYHFSTTDYKKLLKLHDAPSQRHKAELRAALQDHACQSKCKGWGSLLVFRYLNRKRLLRVNTVKLPMRHLLYNNDNSSTEEGIVTVNNEIVVDENDDEVARELHVADIGANTLVAHATDFSGFVAAFPHMTMSQLIELSNRHDIAGATSRKYLLVLALLGHECHPGCRGWLTRSLFRERKNDKLIIPRRENDGFR
ncbi:hypothetical protein C8R43DRAFT_1124831 [Mycena crocata]|nr:hypothetical protein C8R43DRAFT_1124831 [Mycena crocata]